MAKLVLTNAVITLNSTDISANVKSITLTTSANEVATTAFGSTAITRTGGLLDSSVKMSLINDYSVIEGLVYPLIGGTATMVVKPNGTAASTSNPSYTFTPVVLDWSPVNGAVGDLNTADVTWVISGPIVKAVV
jgi:hypothetical protein